MSDATRVSSPGSSEAQHMENIDSNDTPSMDGPTSNSIESEHASQDSQFHNAIQNLRQDSKVQHIEQTESDAATDKEPSPQDIPDTDQSGQELPTIQIPRPPESLVRRYITHPPSDEPAGGPSAVPVEEPCVTNATPKSVSNEPIDKPSLAPAEETSDTSIIPKTVPNESGDGPSLLAAEQLTNTTVTSETVPNDSSRHITFFPRHTSEPSEPSEPSHSETDPLIPRDDAVPIPGLCERLVELARIIWRWLCGAFLRLLSFLGCE
jgi:hypothetical protein